MWERLRQYFVTASLGGIIIGWTIAWTSPVLPRLRDYNSTTVPFHITHEEGSWIGSMLAIGALTSAIPSGYLADRFGRKKCILLLTSLPVLIFAILITIAKEIYVFYIARYFLGIATGAACVLAPLYISETTDVDLRGSVSTVFELLVYLGVVITAVIGAYADYLTLTWSLSGLSLVLTSGLLFYPETPVYLVKLNQMEQANVACRYFRRPTHNVEVELNTIKEANTTTSNQNFKKLLMSKATIKGLVATVGLTVAQQLSGIDAVMFYTVQIFQEAGTSMNEFTSSIITTSAELVACMVAVVIVEKANRKTFLYISTIGLCVCLIALGAYFHLKILKIDFYGLGAVPLISMMLYMLMFAIGLGPILWIINGEVFVPEIKGFANGIIILMNWSSLFAVTKTFPTLLFDVGPHITFYVFGTFMALTAVFTVFFVPETKGKTLQEIQVKLNR